MKDVLSYDEIMDIIHSLPKENIDWVEDNKEREAMYDEIFSSGDRRELLLLVKSLYKHKQERKAEGKKLWTIDENAMKRAEKLVYEEFATVLNIEAEEVVPFIEEELERYYAEKAE